MNVHIRRAADETRRPDAGASMVGPAATADQNGGAQLAQRSLLLFEDFDQLLDSDDGFMASVATLLNKSKVCLASSLPVPCRC